MKPILILPAVLLLGGCLSDADTANNRSVLPLAAAPAHDRDADSDEPRKLCESTMEGSEPRTVCY